VPAVRPVTEADLAPGAGGNTEAEPAGASARPSRWGAGRTIHRVLLGVLLLVGVAGQIRVWASDRGLWGDEIAIADNLKRLSVTQLAGPLLHFQTAPPGWLAGEKALLKVLGPDEQILKLPQVTAAIVVLLLTAVAGWYAIGRWASLVAVGLVVTSPLLYYYAGELKQYGFEAAMAMAILVAAGAYGPVAVGPAPPGRRRVITFAAVAAVASAGSYSALMVLAGAAAGIGVVQAWRRRWRDVLVTAAAAAPGLLVGVGQAALRRRHPFLGNQYDFFPHGLAPEHAGPIGILRWLPDMWRGFVASPLEWRYPALVLLLVVAGLVSLVVRGRPVWAAMLAGVFVAAVGAGAVRAYPVEDRVSLYLVAPAAIAVAAAVDGAARVLANALYIRHNGDPGQLPKVARLLAAALLAVATAVGLVGVVRPAAAAAYDEVTQPLYRDEGRDVLREVESRLRPGDVVVAYAASVALINWYEPRYRLPIVGLAGLTATRRCDPATVGQRLAGAERVWYVYGAKPSRIPSAYQGWVVGQLARHGTIVAHSEGFRYAGWTLIDLSAGPDPSPPPTGDDPAYACLSIRRLPR
jgi:hypothetical protein